MAGYDYKKQDKALYLPKAAPQFLQVPPMQFFAFDGSGPPAGAQYQNAVSALYALSYTVKMKFKQAADYYEYTVFPLEGLWSINGGVFDFDNRDNWVWTSMLRQPAFVTQQLFEAALELAVKSKKQIDFSGARLITFDEGLCVQMMHTGPYSTEPATLAVMHNFMAENGLEDDIFGQRKHHEIYLCDPNRVAAERLKTVLRHPVKNK